MKIFSPNQGTHHSQNVCCGKQRSGAMHLTQKVDYGIILLSTLAQKNHLSIRSIAETSKISFAFLQKIARALLHAGLIQATKGKYGGYRLTKSPQDLAIKEIIEALEGPIAIVPCLKQSKNPLCKHINYCQIRPTFQKINQEIQEHLTSKPLSYFIS